MKKGFDEFNLITKDAFGNEIPLCPLDNDLCPDCGVKLTPENTSHWRVFTSDALFTQKVCKSCDNKRSLGPREKAEVSPFN